MRRNKIHKTEKKILKILMGIGIFMMMGTMTSVDVGVLSFNKMLVYWFGSLVLIGVSYLLLRRCERGKNY